MAAKAAADAQAPVMPARSAARPSSGIRRTSASAQGEAAPAASTPPRATPSRQSSFNGPGTKPSLSPNATATTSSPGAQRTAANLAARKLNGVTAISNAAPSPTRTSTRAPSSPVKRKPPPAADVEQVPSLQPQESASEIEPALSHRSSAQSFASATQQTADNVVSHVDDDDQANDEYSRLDRASLLESVRRHSKVAEETLNELEQAKQRIQEHSDQLDELRQQLTQQSQRTDDSLAQAERLEAELSAQLEANTALISKLEAAEKQRQGLHKAVESQQLELQAEREQWTAEKSTLAAEIARFETEIVQLQIRLKQAETSLAESTVQSDCKGLKTPTLTTGPGQSGEDSPSLRREALNQLASLQSQHDVLQEKHSASIAEHEHTLAELDEIRRLNANLMQENESYEVLLRERTMTGEILQQPVFTRDWDSMSTPRSSVSSPTTDRRLSDSSLQGQSAVDLGAELSKATFLEPSRTAQSRLRVVSDASEANAETDARAEIRQLKEANKALSLYVNKIVERIIAHEGFEKVLAADYSPALSRAPSQRRTPVTDGKAAIFTRQQATATGSVLPRSPNVERTRREANALRSQAGNSPPLPMLPPPTPSETRAAKGMSLDWRSLTSIMGGSDSKTKQQVTSPPAGFRPMLLGAAASSSLASTPIPEASVLQRTGPEEEDEEDQRERERLEAEMRLMGIEEHGSPILHTASKEPSISSVVDIGSRGHHRRKSSAQIASPMSIDAQRQANEAMQPRFSHHSSASGSISGSSQTRLSGLGIAPAISPQPGATAADAGDISAAFSQATTPGSTTSSLPTESADTSISDSGSLPTFLSAAADDSGSAQQAPILRPKSSKRMSFLWGGT
ncbi:hypothetical protein E5Q_05378 [Mixia osmundae IAM 14324]|uniref:Uncharacterized protein n=1 Tax=Mixia osmundae (strain CBS 9802 / IAM 14324 / JCM 22182 / KY 12970) TaxID=764103 RepID=G7E779_MIXOS|nr:hypothetical protein E5Q_05378 [Mixia osmundae IAM 14324]